MIFVICLAIFQKKYLVFLLFLQDYGEETEGLSVLQDHLKSVSFPQMLWLQSLLFMPFLIVASRKWLRPIHAMSALQPLQACRRLEGCELFRIWII